MNKIERLHAGGILRTGSPDSGFGYRRPGGGPVGADDFRRIASLGIPPAWEDVAINASVSGELQAVGRDKAGRWQYLYHASHDRRRERQKFRRLVHFAQALPKLRKAVKSDLRRKDLVREKVLACVLRILSTCFLRPGSRVYADENGSYGIATLRPSHVCVTGDIVTFDFKGKSGKRQHHELRDPAIARIVRRLLKSPGKQVFKFRNETGAIVFLRRRHINQYIKDVMGGRFSAKDFRTWAGTLICACELARVDLAAEDGPKTRKGAIVAAIRRTAEHLGNTPAVCRSSYISPAILDRFETGMVIKNGLATVGDLIAHRGSGLHASEKALLDLLKQEGAPRPKGLARLLKASLKTQTSAGTEHRTPRAPRTAAS